MSEGTKCYRSHCGEMLLKAQVILCRVQQEQKFGLLKWSKGPCVHSNFSPRHAQAQPTMHLCLLHSVLFSQKSAAD